MLPITIPPQELFNEKTYEIIEIKGGTIQLEHSLMSLSKWERKWKKPFLSRRNNKNSEEFLDYIRCMTITQNVNEMLYFGLTNENYIEIAKYIEDPMSARPMVDLPSKGRREIITSELIYYCMFTYNIPKECEKWHLNRLLNLINLFIDKNTNPKKRRRVTQSDMIERRKLNEERKKMFNTKG